MGKAKRGTVFDPPAIRLTVEMLERRVGLLRRLLTLAMKYGGLARAAQLQEQLALAEHQLGLLRNKLRESLR